MKAGSSAREAKPPDLNDMFLAGLPLRRAVEIEQAIEDNPDVEPSYWWLLIRQAGGSG